MHKSSDQERNVLSLLEKDTNAEAKNHKQNLNTSVNESIIVDNVEVIARPSNKKNEHKKIFDAYDKNTFAEKKPQFNTTGSNFEPKIAPEFDLEAAANAILLADGVIEPEILLDSEEDVNDFTPEKKAPTTKKTSRRKTKTIVDIESQDGKIKKANSDDVASSIVIDADSDDDNADSDNLDADDDDIIDVGEEHEDADALDDFTETSIDTFSLNTPAPVSSSKDSLHLYLKEISRFPMLKPEEEQELARRVVESNDRDAAFRLVSSHLRLVVKIAMDFQRRWMQNVLDLVQEGNVGLMRAVNKFDPDKGIKFSYYAAFWIKAYILKFIMDNWRMVKIGTTQAQRKLFYNLNKERQKLILQGFDPDAAALSERLNVTKEQVIEMEQRLDASDVSLDVPVGDDANGASRMDFLPALGPGVEEALSNHEIASMVQDKLKTIIPLLSEKELDILHERLLSEDPITLREIGEKYHITRERVRQIEARLLQKIRDHLFKEIDDFSADWIAR